MKCSIIDIETLSALLNSKDKNEMFLIHMNTRSLPQNISKIQEFLESELTVPDIICISETKTNEKTDMNCVQLENYSFVANNSKTCFGGTGIYILNNLSFFSKYRFRF